MSKVDKREVNSNLRQEKLDIGNYSSVCMDAETFTLIVVGINS